MQGEMRPGATANLTLNDDPGESETGVAHVDSQFL